jgi:hypothetical protein
MTMRVIRKLDRVAIEPSSMASQGRRILLEPIISRFLGANIY